MKITIASTESTLVTQIGKFVENYPTYNSILKVAPAKIINLGKGLAMLAFVVNEQDVIKTFGISFTAYKNSVLNGNQTMLNAIPVLTAYPAILPELCNGGVEGLLREIAQDCVATGALTETMAIALGLLELATIVDLTLGTANLSSKPSIAGHPKLHCTIGDYDGYEIWRDTGKGYVMIDVSTIPDFIDYAPLPAIGTSEVWNYKAIYRYKNEQIGNWSIVVSVAVTGNV